MIRTGVETRGVKALSRYLEMIHWCLSGVLLVGSGLWWSSGTYVLK